MADIDLGAIIKDNVATLLPATWYCLALLAVRAVFYKLAIPRLRRTIKGDGKPVTATDVTKILEEGFSGLVGILLLAVGLYTLPYSDRGDCGFRSTVGCFDAWPQEQRHPKTTNYFHLEIGWYTHFFFRAALGIGMQDTFQMQVHHIASLVLILMQYLLNLQRIGMVVLCLLNISTPLLHAAKFCHNLEWGTADKVLFALFSLVFAATRIVLYPWLILTSTLYYSGVSQPLMLRGAFLSVYLPTNSLLVVLAVLQVLWFKAILRILKQALFGDRSAFKAASHKHDPIHEKQQ